MLFFGRKYMEERSLATGEVLKDWILKDVECSLQSDSSSCGIFVLMVRNNFQRFVQ